MHAHTQKHTTGKEGGGGGTEEREERRQGKRKKEVGENRGGELQVSDSIWLLLTVTIMLESVSRCVQVERQKSQKRTTTSAAK